MLSKNTVKKIAACVISAGIVFSAGTCEAQLVKAKSSSNASAAENEKRMRMLNERRLEKKAANAYKIDNLKNVATEPTPADVYKGADKAKLKDLVLNAWKEEYPKDEVMGVRFIESEWEGNKNVHYSEAEKGYYVNDKAVLTVAVVVKTSPDTATIFPAFINKNNKTGEMNAGVQTKSRSYVVKQMLVANYKE